MKRYLGNKVADFSLQAWFLREEISLTPKHTVIWISKKTDSPRRDFSCVQAFKCRNCLQDSNFSTNGSLKSTWWTANLRVRNIPYCIPRTKSWIRYWINLFAVYELDSVLISEMTSNRYLQVIFWLWKNGAKEQTFCWNDPRWPQDPESIWPWNGL